MDSKRKIAVLGDMFELGDFSEALHKNVGKEIYLNNIDNLILIGKNAKFIAEGAEELGYKKEKIIYCNDKKELIKKIKENINEGDAILFKASNGMKLFEVVDELKKEE